MMINNNSASQQRSQTTVKGRPGSPGKQRNNQGVTMNQSTFEEQQQ
jgi:hypothetical protein